MGCGGSKDEATSSKSPTRTVTRRNQDPAMTEWLAANEHLLAHDSKLGGAPIQLLDAKFLVALHDDRKRLKRRQDLPASAFLTLPQLRKLGKGASGSLRVIVLSHPWLDSATPDPKGTTLAALAEVLRVYIRFPEAPGTYAVFIDFCSLHQKPPGKERTPAENELFKCVSLMHTPSHHDDSPPHVTLVIACS